MQPEVQFDTAIADLVIAYGRRVSARGLIDNSLGNIAIRVPHPAFEHGVVYTKHSEISLEEMTLDNVVITDIPSPRLLHGHVMTSVGHNLNREILRLRPDINAVVHVHHDETIAFFASGGFKQLAVLSLDFPYVMAKPPHYVPSHLDVEEDVSPIKEFIQHTNSVIMLGHGVTTLGRTVSEAYHRLCTYVAEMRRNILAEQLAGLIGSAGNTHDQAAVDYMYAFAESVIYPDRVKAATK